MSASEGRHGPQSGFLCSDSAISAYRFVVPDGANSAANLTVVKAASGNAAAIIGATFEATTAANQNVGVNHGAGQIVYLEVDGSGTAVTAGARLTADSVGRGVVTTTATHHVGAVALAGATTAGAIIPVMLTPCAFGA
ncbi:TPA: hypothetical protein DDW35_11190 [Candidatus Sumerlaeota bacterium]|jgi:hypothetical protein|nr:hypothetical protein [Candidatus Sumerlaeota bacterium]